MSAPKTVVTLPDAVQPMIAEAQRSGIAMRSLPCGMIVSVSWNDPGWTLIIARPEIPPTGHDIAVIRNAFDVPEEALQVPFERAGIRSILVEWGKELEQEVGR